MHTYARRSLMTVWLTGNDYRESPVLARPLGVGLRSRARRGSHCPVVVVSTYAERRGVHRLHADEPVDCGRVRADQGAVVVRIITVNIHRECQAVHTTRGLHRLAPTRPFPTRIGEGPLG